MNAGDALQPFDAWTVRRRASERSEQARREVELCELQLRQRPPLRPGAPQLKHRGIILRDERRANPQRVQVTGGARWWQRRGGRLLAEPLEQRHRDGVALVAKPERVPRGERQSPLDRGAPGDQRGRGACDDSHADERPALRRGENRPDERREPEERVPLRPRAVRAPEPQAADRRQRGPCARRGEGPRDAFRFLRAAHQRGCQQNERHRRYGKSRLPRHPQLEADAARRRRDAAAEIAYDIWRREDQDRGSRHPPPRSPHAAAP